MTLFKPCKPYTNKSLHCFLHWTHEIHWKHCIEHQSLLQTPFFQKITVKKIITKSVEKLQQTGNEIFPGILVRMHV